jgi:hypothetical protein
MVSAGYFQTLEMPIVDGRPFDARDRDGAPRTVIVNQTMANRLWPGQRAVGQRLIQGDDDPRALEVVGVARDAKMRLVSDGPTNFVYVPLAQQFGAEVTFYVKRRPGASRAGDLRREVMAFDPRLPVVHTDTLAQATALSLLPQRLAAWIAGSVAIVGLFLVGLGIHGLTAFAVSQRRREIAIRMALGAQAGAVVWLVLRQAVVVTVVGSAIGLALGAGAALVMRGFLIGLAPVDPVALAAGVVLVAGVVGLASGWPARRAAHTSPIASLRLD